MNYFGACEKAKSEGLAVGSSQYCDRVLELETTEAQNAKDAEWHVGLLIGRAKESMCPIDIGYAVEVADRTRAIRSEFFDSPCEWLN